MARQIANYQDLQDAVANWLNRTDLAQEIETFIYLGERNIFRWYRHSNNEKKVAYDMRRNPDTAPGSTELSIQPQIDLPDDYLDTLTLTVASWDSTAAGATAPERAGKPLRRISISEMQARRHAAARNGDSLTGEPEVFTRERAAIITFPEIDSESDWYWEWMYYCDLTGLFDTPTSDTNVLKTAPDLYLYAALMEAEPFLKTEDELKSLEKWTMKFERAKQLILEQQSMEDFSGSVMSINNVFGGGQGSNSQREGWA